MDNALSKLTDNSSRFNSLVRNQPKKKKRCLKCHKLKELKGYICAVCAQENDKYNFRAESVTSDHNYSTSYS